MTTEKTTDVSEFLIEQKDKSSGSIRVKATVESGETYEFALIGTEEFWNAESSPDGGYFWESIEFYEPPLTEGELPDSNQHPTVLGDLTMEEDYYDGWGDATLRSSVQVVSDGEILLREQHALGTVAAIEEVER